MFFLRLKNCAVRFAESFQALVAAHNSEYNKLGVPNWCSNKRKAEGQIGGTEKSVKVEESVSLDPIAAVPDGSLALDCTVDFALHISKEKDIYLEAKKDIVLGNGTALLLGYGEYRTDNELAKRKKNSAKLFPFLMADVNYVAHFDTRLQSLKDYLMVLENDKEIVSPFVAAHKVTYGNDKEPVVENTEECAFELKSLAQNMQVSQQNGLSFVMEKVNFEKWSVGDGKHLTIFHRLKFQEEQAGQPAGIFPLKPGLFLSKPVAVTSGKIYKLS